jgi:hypothetical protein
MNQILVSAFPDETTAMVERQTDHGVLEDLLEGILD